MLKNTLKKIQVILYKYELLLLFSINNINNYININIHL